MLFYAAVAYVVLYTVHQVLGFTIAVGLVVATVTLSLLRPRLLTWTSKDSLYALYAAIAVVPSLRFFDPYSFTFFLRVVLYPWAVSFVFQNVVWSWPRLRLWVGVTLSVCFVTVAVMLFQEAPGSFEVSLDRLLTLDRTRGFYYRGDERIGPNAAAAMSVMGLALTLAVLRFRRAPLVVALPLIGCFGLMLGVSGGRIATVGFLALVAQFVVTGVIREEGPRLRHVGQTVVLVALLGVGGGALYNTLSATQGERFESRVEGVANPLEDHNLIVRLTDWARAVDMIRSAPNGLGYNAYFESYDRTPHNELLGQWIGGGWAGAFLYLILMGAITARLVRLVLFARPPPLEAFCHYLALSALGLTWLAMITEHISRGGMNTFYPIVWMIVGLSYARTERARSTNPAGDHGPAIPSEVVHGRAQ